MTENPYIRKSMLHFGWNEGYDQGIEDAMTLARGRTREWFQEKLEALRKKVDSPPRLTEVDVRREKVIE